MSFGPSFDCLFLADSGPSGPPNRIAPRHYTAAIVSCQRRLPPLLAAQ